MHNDIIPIIQIGPLSALQQISFVLPFDHPIHKTTSIIH